MGNLQNLHLTRLLFYDILKGGSMRKFGAGRPGRRRPKEKEDSKVLSPFVLGVAFEILLGGERMSLAIRVEPHCEFLRCHLVIGLLKPHVLLLAHCLALLTLLLYQIFACLSSTFIIFCPARDCPHQSKKWGSALALLISVRASSYSSQMLGMSMKEREAM